MSIHAQLSNLSLAEALESLVGQHMNVIPPGDTWDDGAARALFTDKAILRFNYWRLSSQGHSRLSSFDHGQQYGLPAKIDAVSDLQKSIGSRNVIRVQLLVDKADLIITFDNGDELQVFGFTGYEVWDIQFPDKSGQYSNYI